MGGGVETSGLTRDFSDTLFYTLSDPCFLEIVSQGLVLPGPGSLSKVAPGYLSNVLTMMLENA